MRIIHLFALSFLAVVAAGADGGCFGDPDPDGPPRVDGGVSSPLAVAADTAEPGPFRPGDPVALVASAEGGSPPYTFVWRAPARTLDADTGAGEVEARRSSFVVRVDVVDAGGAEATGVVEVEVEHAHPVLEVSIEGPGHVRTGDGDVCVSSCRLEVEYQEEVTLVAEPVGHARFAGWSGCSDEKSRTIVVPVGEETIFCAAHFATGQMMIPCDEMPPPPVAEVTVRPSTGAAPFPLNGEGLFLVPPSTRIVIDGGGSRPQNGDELTYRWSVTWDPLQEVPSASVPFFRILSPGFSNERVDAVLEVEDGCGQTATATAGYVTT